MIEYAVHLHNENDTIAAAIKLAAVVTAPCALFFHGELGAGKTTYIRSFLKAQGVIGRIKSPTYALVEVYELPNHCQAAHFDFYRINAVEELDNLGVDEYFTASSICLVEWPQKAGEYLPAADLHCYLSYVGDERYLRIVAASLRGQSILAHAYQ